MSDTLFTVPFTPPPKREWDAIHRKLDKARDNCDCTPGEWAYRVSSPGFDQTSNGMSMWCCTACGPMCAKFVDRLYGSHDEAGRAA